MRTLEYICMLNQLLFHKHLQKDHLDAITDYKYQCIDTSPFSNYILNPIWNQVVKVVPSWISPNFLTFLGFLLTFFNFLLLSVYDFEFLSSTSLDPKIDAAIPSWIWLFLSISNFLAYSLDCVDGKHARKTRTSSPLGELLDHGLDSWSCSLIPLTFYSVLGQFNGGLSPRYVYFILSTCLFVFISAHWEKYNTKVLYLTWFYDPTHIVVSFLFFYTYIYGYQVWHSPIFTYPFYCNVGALVLLINVFSAFTAFVCSFYAIIKYHIEVSRKWPGITVVFYPLFPIFSLFLLSSLWMYISPNDIVSIQPRIFFFTMGTIFSNIACKLIIAQLAKSQPRLHNFMLYLLGVIVVMMFTFSSIPKNVEVSLLFSLSLCVLVFHLQFGFSVSVLTLGRYYFIGCRSQEEWQIAFTFSLKYLSFKCPLV